MRRLPLVALLAAGGAGATLLAAACLRPTQITVVITTDLPCSQYRGVTFAVGRLGELESRAPSMTTTECIAGKIGSIVVLPSGDDDGDIAFKVVAGNGRSADSCVAPAYGPQCIVARRSLRFIPHTPLTVPIAMRASCDGIPCGPIETCVFGQCRPATIPRPEDCAGSGCSEEVLIPGGGVGGDGGPGEGGIRDGGSEGGSDGGADAQPPIEGGTGSCVGAAGFQVGAPWPVRGGCSTHASSTSVIGPTASASVKWSIAIGLGTGTPDTSAVVGADGTIFVGGDTLRAIAPDGSLKWSNGRRVQTTPALGVDTVYVVDDQQTLVARTFDGVMRWSRAIPGSPQCSPNIGADGTVYISGELGRTGAVAPDGGERWGFDGNPGAPPMLQSPAVGADGTVYGSPVAGGVYIAQLPTDGGVKWAGGVGAPTLYHPVATASGVTFNPTLYALRAFAADGTSLWSFTDFAGGNNMVAPALGPDGTVVIPRSNAGVLGLHDQRDGGEIWNVAISAGALGHPLVDGEGTIYIGAATNEVIAVRPNRSIKWRVAVAGPVAGPLAMGADGTIYAVVGDGRLYAIR